VRLESYGNMAASSGYTVKSLNFCLISAMTTNWSDQPNTQEQKSFPFDQHRIAMSVFTIIFVFSLFLGKYFLR